MSKACVVGVFVGGASRRMGGAPKGLLPAPDTGEPLAVRLVRLAQQAGFQTVLVGGAEPYRAVLPDHRALADRPPSIGPLGGLGALLEWAGEGDCIALACDMPFITRDLLSRLTVLPDDADVLAARAAEAGPWQPLFARYHAPTVRPHLRDAVAAGERSFQALFARLRIAPLSLTEAQRAALRDWDRPEDVTA